MAYEPKLIPLFNGTDAGQSVVEWVEKAELVCRLSGVKNIECVVPMRLSGDGYAVYQQLSEEKRADFACINDVLYTAFALSPVTAYKQFAALRLRPGETVDVFLAELRKLATQFGGMTERGLVCAFIDGLPEHAENLLQATTRVDDLPISEILARARAILKDSFTGTESAAAAAQLPGFQEKGATALRRCYVCPRSPKTLIWYSMQTTGPRCTKLSGKRVRGRVFSASLFPRPHLNGALPVVSVQIDGVRRTALVDAGCTQTLVRKPCCRTWEEKASSLAGCRRELVNVLWRERGPNWHRQWTFSRRTSSGCRWGSVWIWSATWAECVQKTWWNDYVWHRRSEISSGVKDWCVLPLPSTSLTFMLNMTRPSAYGLHLGKWSGDQPTCVFEKQAFRIPCP